MLVNEPALLEEYYGYRDLLLTAYSQDANRRFQDSWKGFLFPLSEQLSETEFSRVFFVISSFQTHSFLTVQ
jgi:hypothetical protein